MVSVESLKQKMAMAKGGKSPRPSTSGGSGGSGTATGTGGLARGNHDHKSSSNYGPGDGNGSNGGGRGGGGIDRRIDRSSSSDRGGPTASGGAASSGGIVYNGSSSVGGQELKGLSRGAGRGIQQTRPAWMTEEPAGGLGAASSSSSSSLMDSTKYGGNSGYDAGAFAPTVPGQFDHFSTNSASAPYGLPMMDPSVGVPLIHGAYPISLQQQQYMASVSNPPIQQPSSSSYVPPGDGGGGGGGGFLQQIQVIGAKTTLSARDPRPPPGQGLAPGPSQAAGQVETFQEKTARLAKNMAGKRPKGH